MLPTRIAVVVLLVIFIVIGVVVPTLRLKRRAGHTGYVADRTASPVHRLAVEGLRFTVFALLGWVALVLTLPAERLGIWTTAAHALFWPAVLLSAAGMALVVTAQRTMGTSWRVGIDTEQKTALVTSGLFARVRNPIFSGMLLAALGLALLTVSPWSLCGWLFLLYVLALQTRLEEEHLRGQHGAPYEQYAARVGRFVPGVGRLSPPHRGAGPTSA